MQSACSQLAAASARHVVRGCDEFAVPPGVARLAGDWSSRDALGEVRLSAALVWLRSSTLAARDRLPARVTARAGTGGGIVLDAIHELDYLRWLLGPVDRLWARPPISRTWDIDVEDLRARPSFDSRFGSLRVTVDPEFFEPGYRRGCRILGSARLPGGDMDEWGSSDGWISGRYALARGAIVRCDGPTLPPPIATGRAGLPVRDQHWDRRFEPQPRKAWRRFGR